MGNNLTAYSIAICDENIYFLTPRFKFNKREKNDDNQLLETSKTSLDSIDYHVSNCRYY